MYRFLIICLAVASAAAQDVSGAATQSLSSAATSLNRPCPAKSAAVGPVEFSRRVYFAPQSQECNSLQELARGLSGLAPSASLAGLATFNVAGKSAILLAQNQQTPPTPQNKSSQAATSTGQNKDQEESNSPAPSKSPNHIFWVIPAYKVEYGQGFQPLTPKEKFKEWAQAAYDPLGLGAGAVEAATLEHSSSDGFCGYGGGWVGYGKCFGALQLDANVSSFTGDYALAVLLHQDPRYFRLGQGSFGRRLWYSVSRVFVTYNDSGRTVFYSSALAGTAIAAGVSNLYYPKQDVGVGHSISRVAIDLGNTALYNVAAEFWPDIHRELRKIF